MFYIDEINPPFKRNLSCSKTTAYTLAYTIFIREVQSHSCEWLKNTSGNGGTPPTVALVKYFCKAISYAVGFVSRKRPSPAEARIGLSYAVEKGLFRLNFFRLDPPVEKLGRKSFTRDF